LKDPVKGPHLAEFIGALLGDGSVGCYQCKAGDKIKTQYRVKISGDASEDLDYFSDFLKPLMNGLFDKEPLLRFKRGERTLELLYFGQPVYEYLLNLGVAPSPKRDRAVIPPFILQEGLGKHFLRGLFDTDGCVIFDKQKSKEHSYPRLEIKMLPSPMRKQTLEILSYLGFRPIISPQQNGCIRIQMNGKSLLEKWVKEIKFHNPRHETKYEIWKRLGYYITNTNIEYRQQVLRDIDLHTAGLSSQECSSDAHEE
jgi:hypothetical protein